MNDFRVFVKMENQNLTEADQLNQSGQESEVKLTAKKQNNQSPDTFDDGECSKSIKELNDEVIFRHDFD